MKNTLDPIDFLAKIGIYREGSQFFKVQVVGIRQPDLEYLFLNLQRIGEKMAVWAGKEMQFQSIEQEDFEDFEFGGLVEMLGISSTSFSVPYIGELRFETSVVQLFEAEDKNFWE